MTSQNLKLGALLRAGALAAALALPASAAVAAGSGGGAGGEGGSATPSADRYHGNTGMSGRGDRLVPRERRGGPLQAPRAHDGVGGGAGGEGGAGGLTERPTRHNR